MSSVRELLAEPFKNEDVRFFPKVVKDGRALALPYADARAYQEHLDTVLGPASWETSFAVLDQAAKAVECRLRACIDGEWVTRTDAGYPNDAKDASNAAQEPLKAAYSDAFKRACTQLGVGRFLYSAELEADWLDVEVDRDGHFRKWKVQPRLKVKRGSVAQRKEQPASNRKAEGSNPSGPAPDEEAPAAPVNNVRAIDQYGDCRRNGKFAVGLFISRMRNRRLTVQEIALVAPHPSGNVEAMDVEGWLERNQDKTYYDLLDLAAAGGMTDEASAASR